MSRHYQPYSQARLYRMWATTRHQCTNVNSPSYKYYGGYGIAVCRVWDESFVAFHGWAITHGYTDGLSLARYDLDGNFEPENCYWTTRDNLPSRRKKIFITYGGETLSLNQWAKRLGTRYLTLYKRYCKGFPDEDILFGRKNRKEKNYD